MDTTAYFIRDRALSLAYEAVQFPATAQVAFIWLHRALAYAKNSGMEPLADDIKISIQHVTDVAAAKIEEGLCANIEENTGKDIVAMGGIYPAMPRARISPATSRATSAS